MMGSSCIFKAMLGLGGLLTYLARWVRLLKKRRERRGEKFAKGVK